MKFECPQTCPVITECNRQIGDAQNKLREVQEEARLFQEEDMDNNFLLIDLENKLGKSLMPDDIRAYYDKAANWVSKLDTQRIESRFNVVIRAKNQKSAIQQKCGPRRCMVASWLRKNGISKYACGSWAIEKETIIDDLKRQNG